MNSKNARVTIGMPLYNAERYVVEAIDSILAQTFKDFVLIISDNGSTDRTQAICEAYAAKDPRVQYHRYEENRGSTWNFNNVFHLAKTPYFKWAGYDDNLAPEMLELCVHVLDREAEVVLAYPWTQIIDGESKVLGPYTDNVELRSPRPHLRLQRYLQNARMVDGIHGVFRSQALAQTALLDTYIASDKVLIAEVVLYGEIREIPVHAFYRRIHEQISTIAYSEYELRAFYDPKKKGTYSLPHLEMYLNYMRRTLRTPMSPVDKARCVGVLLAILLRPKHWIRMVRDMFMVGKFMLRDRLREIQAKTSSRH